MTAKRNYSLRRHFFRQIAGSCLGVSVAAIPDSDAAIDVHAVKPDQSVIYLYMNGGMSHIDTLDPKPKTEAQGPVDVIETSVDGIQLTEYLPRLATLMSDFAIVRSMASDQGAHKPARQLLHTSYTADGGPSTPSLSSWCA